MLDIANVGQKGTIKALNIHMRRKKISHINNLSCHLRILKKESQNKAQNKEKDGNNQDKSKN